MRTKREDQILVLTKISEMEKFKPLMKIKCWGVPQIFSFMFSNNAVDIGKKESS